MISCFTLCSANVLLSRQEKTTLTVHRDAALQQHTGSLQLSPELSSMSLTLWGTTVLFHGAAQVTDTLQTDTSQPKIVCVCVWGSVLLLRVYRMISVTSQTLK